MKNNRRQDAEETSLEDTTFSCVSVIENEGNDSDSVAHSRDKTEMRLEIPVLLGKETIEDVQVNPELERNQINEVQTLLVRFPAVFTDLPGTTSMVKHEIVSL